MPPSLTPGSSIVVSVQNTDVDIGLRHGPKGSALPMFPQIRFARGTVFGATLVRNCYGLSGCWPPSTDLTGLPANGGFYFQAFSGSVALPAAGYDYNSVWTPLLAGLSPAGMAASLAALVRPCSCPASDRNWGSGRSSGVRWCLRSALEMSSPKAATSPHGWDSSRGKYRPGIARSWDRIRHYARCTRS